MRALLRCFFRTREEKRAVRDARHINQQCANTRHTAQTHPLRAGYIKRVKANGCD